MSSEDEDKRRLHQDKCLLRNVDKIDVDKLIPVAVDLSKLNDLLKNDVLKKDVYDAKIKYIR